MIAKIVFCTLNFSLILNLSVLSYIPKKYGVICLAVLIYLCGFYDTGETFEHHGGWNRMFLILFIFLETALLQAILFIIKLARTHWKVLVACCLGIAIFDLLFFELKIKNSCVDWTIGLKGTRLINASPYCEISVPFYCFHEIIGRVTDITKCMCNWGGS